MTALTIIIFLMHFLILSLAYSINLQLSPCFRVSKQIFHSRELSCFHSCVFFQVNSVMNALPACVKTHWRQDTLSLTFEVTHVSWWEVMSWINEMLVIGGKGSLFLEDYYSECKLNLFYFFLFLFCFLPCPSSISGSMVFWISCGLWLLVSKKISFEWK